MKKLFVAALFLLILLGPAQPILTKTIHAQTAESFAECDLCGYCKKDPDTKPSNWESCRKCLYPVQGGTDYTLKIDPITNSGPTPAPGHFFSQVGCVSTNLGDFTKPGAAGALIRILLTRLFQVVGGIAFLYILYGSFVVMTSQDNPERLNYGKRLVIGAIAGLLVSIFSVFLVNLIATQILRIPDFGS